MNRGREEWLAKEGKKNGENKKKQSKDRGESFLRFRVLGNLECMRKSERELRRRV